MKSLLKKVAERCLRSRIRIYPADKPMPRGCDIRADVKDHFGEIKTIFDVGANGGSVALNFGRVFPSARIFCFEPIAGTFAQLQSNTRRHRQINCFQLAIGASAGEVEIHLQEESELNSLVPELNADPRCKRTERVTVDTLDNFCSKQGVSRIDFLKIDTEGFDLEVLRGAEGLLGNKCVRLVFAEVGVIRNDRRYVYFESLKQHLEARGYLLHGIYEQNGLWEQPRKLDFFNALFFLPD